MTVTPLDPRDGEALSEPTSAVQSIPSYSARAAGVPLEPGELIGDRYVYDSPIAEGGMARVVAARHRGLDEPVAIKLLKPDLLTDPALVARFFREAKATARLRSAHIVRVIDVGLDPRRGPYLVMERLHGEDGRRVLNREGRLPMARVAEFGVQLCDALAVAHAKDVVHRDLKPENLFFVTEGVGSDGDLHQSIRLLDFGVAKATLEGSVFHQSVPLVETQGLFGSPYYLAPEQVRAAKEVGASVDIWSLGVCLYEFLTGTPPFTGESLPAVCASILEAPIPPFPNNLPDARETLDGFFAVICKCLARNPAERWSNVVELALALEPFAPPGVRSNIDRMVAAQPITSLLRSERSPNSMRAVPRRDAGQELAATQEIPRESMTSLPAVRAAEPEKAARNKTPFVVGAALLLMGAAAFALRPKASPAQVATESPPTPIAAPQETIHAGPAATVPAALTALPPEVAGAPAVVPDKRPTDPPAARGTRPVAFPATTAAAPRPTASTPHSAPTATADHKVKVLEDKPRSKVLD